MPGMRWVKIFDNWEKTCNILEEDEPRILKIGDKKIVIVRHNDTLHAFEPLCPHQHEPLHRGEITKAGEIVCPLHHYRFNLVTGRECEQRTRDMETFPVKIDTEIFIGID